ncbi:TetR/AcrR family transcriptional regulator [Kribbella sp. NPDC004875]|uniref:TetR/AcrR family transcriptional regulator n=1 Tax=Kribbella sp. NPDC004875 TaxID=3364107 RepID=UPI0036C12277
MTEARTSLRADARRNRQAVLDAARELFTERGDGVQIDEIAERARVGVGTLYRHFSDKQSLLAAIVASRFAAMTAVARAAEQLDDPGEAFRALLMGYLESAEGDAAFRFALLGPQEPDWHEINAEKQQFAEIVERIIRRAADAGHLRHDVTGNDFVLLTRGAMANMTGERDWRRHVALLLDGIRAQ